MCDYTIFNVHDIFPASGCSTLSLNALLILNIIHNAPLTVLSVKDVCSWTFKHREKRWSISFPHSVQPRLPQHTFKCHHQYLWFCKVTCLSRDRIDGPRRNQIQKDFNSRLLSNRGPLHIFKQGLTRWKRYFRNVWQMFDRAYWSGNWNEIPLQWTYAMVLLH